MLTLVTGADGGSRDPHAQIIVRENKWFDISDAGVPEPPRSRIVASRWIGHATIRCEHEANIAPDCHVIGIALQAMAHITVVAGQKLVHDGLLPRGSVRVNEPGLAMRGVFQGAYDVLHLHVPNEMIAEYANAEAPPRIGTMRPIGDRPVVNPVIERLAQSLIHAEELGGSFSQSYVDGISLAITAQLLGGGSDGVHEFRPRVSGLPKWRLRRAIEYIDANISEPISLAEMAAATGLSRMHFAAQFRVATGLRPHEFLLQKRIEHARKLLLTTRTPLVEIALEAGFKTQAHFTTVFSRLVGETPNVWRQRGYRELRDPNSESRVTLSGDTSTMQRGVQAMPSIAPSETIDRRRRHLLGAAATTIATAWFGGGVTASAQTGKSRADELPAIKPGANTSFSAMRQIRSGVLSVGYAEAGPADGPPVMLLHGWPYDIHSYVDVAPLLASAGYRVIVPYARGYGPTRFLSSSSVRNAQPAALAVDAIEMMDTLKIEKAIFAGYDWGARTADIIAALWPERCKALVSVSGYLVSGPEANKAPLPPTAELQWWYQFYFATERGRLGYEKYRHDFAKLIWRIASPQWEFDDATFERTAESFNNPDHVAIVIHDYRFRLGLAEGEAKYADVEKRLDAAPDIAVPTITLEGDANGAPHGDPAAYAKKFTGKYAHRLIKGGIGHNLPQEAPREFAQAVMDADGY